MEINIPSFGGRTGARNVAARMGAIALMCLLCLTSCMDDDDSTTTLSNTCYISSFSIGNVKRTVHTLDSNGKDSTSVESYTASSYAFAIDHLNGTITNPEPLLHESILTSVLCTITSSGTVRYHIISDDPNDELNNDEWTYYSNSDSIDVSRPLLLQVVSTDGTHTRDYTLTVNVHAVHPDSLTWKQEGDCPALASLTTMRASLDSRGLCVVGTDADGQTHTIYPLEETAALEDGGVLDLLHTGLPSLDYMIDNRLIDDDDEWLDYSTVSGARLEDSYGATRYVLAGVRTAEHNDTSAVVCGCDGNATQLMRYTWNRSYGQLPALADLHVVAHDGRFMALGGASLRVEGRKALDRIYVSNDYGMTWNSSTAWTVPASLQGRDEPIAVAAADDKVYVISGTQIWTARSNAL